MSSPPPCSRSWTATTRPPSRSTGNSPPQTWPGSSTRSAPVSTLPGTRPNYRRQLDDPRRTYGVTHLGMSLVHRVVPQVERSVVVRLAASQRPLPGPILRKKARTFSARHREHEQVQLVHKPVRDEGPH